MQTELLTQISQSPRFAIYGAQVVAYGVYVALHSLYNKKPECFIVSNTDGNPANIDDISVKTLENCGLSKDILILVAVTELLQDEICTTLEKNGFYNYICIGAHEEHLLMSEYFNSIGKFRLLNGSMSNTNCDANLAVYEAKNHRDKQLKNIPALKPWEHSIQAGADITDMRIAPLLDNTGENISAKNKIYSEMTATYWVWKNTNHYYKGICHYRRHLILSNKQIAALTEDDIDVVLPLPYICYPNTITQFQRFVSKDVLNTLLFSLRTLHSDKYGEYFSILNRQYQYTYNLLIAKGEVFDRYCEWTFEILQDMERSADKFPEIAMTRALSYAAEVLTSLYFLSNSDKLNIRHIEKSISV
jgi:hypothetical protein